MILYFSGTGNTYSAAKTIANKTGDELFDMGDAYRKGDFTVRVERGDSLGIAFPTYRWSTPPLVDEFIKRMKLVNADGEAFQPRYCFTVETYGHFPGKESAFVASLLKKYHGFEVDSSFGIKTVGNCLYLFNTPEGQTLDRKLGSAHSQENHIANQVVQRVKGVHVGANPLGFVMSLGTGHENKKRSVRVYSVLADKCSGCGTCAAVCPTNTIRIVDGRPVWEGAHCTECLACLHHCPNNATQHGKITEGRRRYLNPILKAH